MVDVLRSLWTQCGPKFQAIENEWQKLLYPLIDSAVGVFFWIPGCERKNIGFVLRFRDRDFVLTVAASQLVGVLSKRDNNKRPTVL